MPGSNIITEIHKEKNTIAPSETPDKLKTLYGKIT